MRIYIAGISGTGMAPLALMAKEAGMEVVGSDRTSGALTAELEQRGIKMQIGEQDGSFLLGQIEGAGVDWFVHTSSIRAGHPELELARSRELKISKRDELTAHLVEVLGLKMIAVAGTHGKTTTTAMIVWLAQQLGIPVSYIVGTRLSFAPAGHYDPQSKFFIYESDEYDRNFLEFWPEVALITSMSHDHQDIYPTAEDYRAAFAQFASQTKTMITRKEIWKKIQSAEKTNAETEVTAESPIEPKVIDPDEALSNELVQLNLANPLPMLNPIYQLNAPLVGVAMKLMIEKTEENRLKTASEKQSLLTKITMCDIIERLGSFPGGYRRFERIAPGVISDYAHHPEEIELTLRSAQVEAKRMGKKGVIALYEPHQNQRQLEVYQAYGKAFAAADEVWWLPTFLTREPAGSKILTFEELTAEIAAPATAVRMDENLAKMIKMKVDEGLLVILMSAGPADEWLRRQFGETDT